MGLDSEHTSSVGGVPSLISSLTGLPPRLLRTPCSRCLQPQRLLMSLDLPHCLLPSLSRSWIQAYPSLPGRLLLHSVLRSGLFPCLPHRLRLWPPPKPNGAVPTCPLPELHLPGAGTLDSARSSAWQRRVGPAENIPMLQRPHLLQLLRKQGWQALLQNTQARDELRHHCPECMQWCATSAGLKVHMTHAHPRWTQEQPSILSRAVLLKRVITRPCQYCLADRFDKQQHWRRCPSVLHGNKK